MNVSRCLHMYNVVMCLYVYTYYNTYVCSCTQTTNLYISPSLSPRLPSLYVYTCINQYAQMDRHRKRGAI